MSFHRVLAALLIGALMPLSFGQAPTPAVTTEAPWRLIASVLKHPRCLNCHPNTQFPRQGDDRHRHQQLVMRGAQNHGVPTLRCSTCHQQANSADGKVPGSPHWQLAPLSMAWEGLDDQQLCVAVKDRSKNGNRDLDALLHHMLEDPLVQWAWSPGARLKPTVDQAEFHAAVKAWAASGGVCQ